MDELVARNSLTVERKNTLFIVLIAAAIIAGVVWGYYFFVFQNVHTRSSIPFVVSVGTVPASRLYRENTKTSLLEPVTVTYKEDQLSVLDVINAPNSTTYYILADKASVPVGNVYKKDAQGIVTKLTNSQTAKYNLAYNPVQDIFVYQSLAYVDEKQFVSTRDWSLTKYSEKTQKEQSIALGSNPVFTTDGSTLIYRSAESILLLNLGTNATSSVFSLANYPVYAVDARKHELYAFNRKTAQVDIYAITTDNTFSYRKSISIDFIPTALGFVGDTLYAAAVQGNSKSEQRYIFSKVDERGATHAFSVNAIAGFAAPQRIYLYE